MKKVLGVAMWVGTTIVVSTATLLAIRYIGPLQRLAGLQPAAAVIESLFAPAIPEGVRHFLPFSAGYRLLDAGPNFEAPVAIADLLGRPQYALIFGGYALISLTIGTLLLYRRDSN